MQTRPANARVLFDEAHGEAWSVRAEVAAEMQPSHPADSSYVRAAEALRRRDLEVATHASGPLDATALEGADVLVIAHPSEPEWERTVPGGGSPQLTTEELDAVEAFVMARKDAVDVVDVLLHRNHRAPDGDKFLLDFALAVLQQTDIGLHCLQDLVDQFVADFRHRALRHNLR